jgi:hypothetical protein
VVFASRQVEGKLRVNNQNLLMEEFLGFYRGVCQDNRHKGLTLPRPLWRPATARSCDFVKSSAKVGDHSP